MGIPERSHGQSPGPERERGAADLLFPWGVLAGDVDGLEYILPGSCRKLDPGLAVKCLPGI